MYSLTPVTVRGSMQVCIFNNLQQIRFRSTSSSSFSAARLRKENDDRKHFEVDCRGSGSIRVDVFHEQKLRDPLAPLIVYLPPTGVHLSHLHPPIPSYLLSSNAALARINYRWNIPPSTFTWVSKSLLGKNPPTNYHPFPFPVHDTFQAWSHIIETYLPSFSSKEPTRLLQYGMQNLKSALTTMKPSPNQKRNILIYGDFLGATLATSLALTVNFGPNLKSLNVTPPSTLYDIRLVAKRGVYDWIDIGTSKAIPEANKKYKKDVNEDKLWWNKKTLFRLRESLFVDPRSCFDAFASPTLFFRSVAMVSSEDWLTVNEEPVFNHPEYISPKGSRKTGNNNDDPYNKISENWSTILNQSKVYSSIDRCSYSHFPPVSSGLEIPKTLFLYLNKSSDQNEGGELLILKTCDDFVKKAFKKKLAFITPKRQAKYMAMLMKKFVDKSADPARDIQARGFSGDHNQEKIIVNDWLKSLESQKLNP